MARRLLSKGSKGGMKPGGVLYIYIHLYIRIILSLYIYMCEEMNEVCVKEVPSSFRQEGLEVFVHHGDRRREVSTMTTSIGVFVIRIGFWGPLYYTYNKEPPK